MKNPESSIKLGRVGAKFRRDILKNFQFEEVQDFERLNLACHCLDRVHECRDLIKREGLFVKDRFNVTKAHPGVEVERQQKILFIRILRELNLDLTAAKDLRSPKLY